MQHTDFFLERADKEIIKKKIYSLRYRAYRSVEAIPPNTHESFSDDYDLQTNITSYLLSKHDGTAIGSIRACVYVPQSSNKIPAFDSFQNEISTSLGLNKVIVESNRYTIDPDFQANPMRYNILLFKAIFFHVIQSNADYVITAVRKKHISFYQKMLKMNPISEEKYYPNLSFSVIMMAGNASESAAHAVQHIPIIEPKIMEIEECQKFGVLRF